MATLNFRAWDTVRNEYLSAGEVHLSVQAHERPKDIIVYLDNILNRPNRWRDRFIIEQSTGKRDVVDVEIFEGDVFVAPHDFGPGGFSNEESVVFWHTDFGYQWNYWDMKRIKVIGHKHEELFKEKYK